MATAQMKKKKEGTPRIRKLADDFRDSVAEKPTPVDKAVTMFDDGGDDDDLPF